MDKRYKPADHEQDIYQLWQDNNLFNPDTVKPSSDRRFSIIMPPPNANDPLHIGHAMFLSLEDILIRYHRMLGHDTVWIPGTDHAGIETQFVYEKKLKKQKKSRFDFDRQTLYDQIWEYVQQNSDVAVNQMKKLGSSADWSRFKFMLDQDIVEQVETTFNNLYEQGLIYRDLQLVNYSPAAGTSYSELEVVYQDRTSPLYYLKYGPFTLATTRPETKFGDTAVAVHPEDQRYQEFIGQEIEVMGLEGSFKLKVIADEYVDPAFGTGAVKITPFHDFNDFLVWQRHKSELPEPVQVIDFNGRMTEAAGKYQGLKVAEARKLVAEDLKAKGLLVKVDTKYQNRVATCYKTGCDIEPLPLPQFFVKVKPLVEPVLAALDKGEITVHGAGHDKILRHWLQNLRDWNISRQIVWGIRIPVWYDTNHYPQIQVTFLTKDQKKVSGTVQELLKDHSIQEISQGLQELRAPAGADFTIDSSSPGDSFLPETDTFDTWFSSSQWPVTTLKATQPTDFDRFYPTTVMETGYDILPFWVMRMLMMGKFMTGHFPFHTVYLHGLVRDEQGQKMSKSKGNVTNPLEIVDQYGADALRMSLVIRSSAGLDKSVGLADFKAGRNLNNKLWNAARFVQGLSSGDFSKEPDADTISELDAAFAKKLTQTVDEITTQLNDYKLGLAADTVYNQFWHWYCDQAIEACKNGQLSLESLKLGLHTFLKLLHPFIPFVTEKVWQELKTDFKWSEPFLITAKWPKLSYTN